MSFAEIIFNTFCTRNSLFHVCPNHCFMERNQIFIQVHGIHDKYQEKEEFLYACLPFGINQGNSSNIYDIHSNSFLIYLSVVHDVHSKCSFHRKQPTIAIFTMVSLFDRYHYTSVPKLSFSLFHKYKGISSTKNLNILSFHPNEHIFLISTLLPSNNESI